MVSLSNHESAISLQPLRMTGQEITFIMPRVSTRGISIADVLSSRMGVALGRIDNGCEADKRMLGSTPGHEMEAGQWSRAKREAYVSSSIWSAGWSTGTYSLVRSCTGRSKNGSSHAPGCS